MMWWIVKYQSQKELSATEVENGGGGIRTRSGPKQTPYTITAILPQIATFGPKNAVLTNRSRHKPNRARTRQNTN